MRMNADSTAHYAAVIADLRAEYKQLMLDAQNAEQLAREKAKKAADTQNLIENLELRSGSTYDARPAAPITINTPASIGATATQTTDLVKGLGLGDACIAVLRALGRPASNRDIVEALQSNGFSVNSENPINNVGSCLNHRMKTKRDVARHGREWVIATGVETSTIAPMNSSGHTPTEN